MTLPQIDPIELSKWQGKVDERFTNIGEKISDLNGRVRGVETKVDELPDRIEKRVEKVIANHNERRVTFRWLLEKIALPLIVGGVSAAGTIIALANTFR